MPKKRIKATLEDIANELSDQSEVLAGLQAALSQVLTNQAAADVKAKSTAAKLHDTQALVLQTTRSIANG